MAESALLDSAFLALLDDPRVALRPPAPGVAMADYRRRLDRPMAALAGPPVAAVETVRGGDGCGVDLRLYRPVADPRATILFIHGGGFVTGSLETHDALCRTLAVASGASVVALDYRLAPEAPFPAARDDCGAALRWLATNGAKWGLGGPLAIGGDSAGGHLATMTALDGARDGIALATLGLLYPVVAPACASASWHRLGQGYLLTRDWMRWAWAAYRADADPAALDLLHADLGLLPPTHILTAAFDPLRDEGDMLGAAIRAAGGTATTACYPGMIHGFANLPMLTPAADLAIGEIASHFCQHRR